MGNTIDLFTHKSSFDLLKREREEKRKERNMVREERTGSASLQGGGVKETKVLWENGGEKGIRGRQSMTEKRLDLPKYNLVP